MRAICTVRVRGASASDPARSLGVGESTVRRYLDFLTQTYMIRQLQPWHENLGKRQVKHPKIYFPDSGLLHALLGIRSEADLLTHPKSGASWEGFALEQVIRAVRPDELHFWATHNAAKLDLLLFKNGQRLGYKFKRSDVPRLSASMRSTFADLGLSSLEVIYPGSVGYALADGITVRPLSAYAQVELRR